jgi:hypothetical protein
MLNIARSPISIANFGAIQQRGDLPSGQYIEKLQITLDAVLDIAAGGGADGVVITDGVARLIRRLQVKRDNETIVDLTGRDLLILTRASVKTDAISGTQLSGAGVGAQTLALTLTLPFARPWLVNPFETVLPPMAFNNQFAVFVDWAQDVNAGGGDAGGGVLVSGGTRVITFTTDPTLTIVVYAAQRGKLPWFLPYYTSTDTEQFNAANTRLEYKLNEARRFDAVFLSPRSGALLADADMLNYLTMGAQSQNFIDGIRATDLRTDQRQNFAGAGTDLNYYLLLAEGGWIGNAVEPTEMTKPFFRFDVDAPAVNPGIVHMIFSELISHPDYTLHGQQGRLRAMQATG